MHLTGTTCGVYRKGIGYDEAIERIETLWGAESGTPEGDELDVLLTWVKVYEKENHPVPPPTPIEAINFIMDQRFRRF